MPKTRRPNKTSKKDFSPATRVGERNSDPRKRKKNKTAVQFWLLSSLYKIYIYKKFIKKKTNKSWVLSFVLFCLMSKLIEWWLYGSVWVWLNVGGNESCRMKKARKTNPGKRAKREGTWDHNLERDTTTALDVYVQLFEGNCHEEVIRRLIIF